MKKTSFGIVLVAMIASGAAIAGGDGHGMGISPVFDRLKTEKAGFEKKKQPSPEQSTPTPTAPSYNPAKK